MAGKSWTEFVINCPEGVSDALSGALFDLGCEGITEDGGSLTAYFSSDADAVAVEVSLGRFEGVTFTCRQVEDQDWYAGWKEGMGPYRAAGLLICPPWKAADCHPGPDEKFVMMDPGQAFGTGDHQTTVTVLGMLKEWAESQEDVSGKRLLDLGTGTGILSIAAYQFGVRDITAVDVEPKAVESAGRNFALNAMVGKVRLMPGSIADAGRGYDLVVANIFQEVLIDAMEGIAGALNPGGTVMLSGLLSGQEGPVLEAANKHGLTLVEKRTADGWVSLVLSGRVPQGPR